MIRIEVLQNVVNLYKNTEETPISSFRISEMPITFNNNGHEISKLIYHLMFKNWIDESTLYEIASLIQKKFPTNNIDWIKTFFPIEKKLYLNHVKITKELTIENENTKEASKSLLERVEIGIEEQNDFVNGEILKIVKNNLQKYNLK